MNYKEAFDKIKSDDKSKARLKEAVLKGFEKKKQRKINILSRFAASFLIITVVSAVTGLYYLMPVNYVSIDIDSIGVQLGLSNAGYVVSWYNDEIISDELDVKRMDVGRAVSKITEAIETGESFYSALAVVSVHENNTKVAGALKLKVEKAIMEYASAHNIHITVYYANTNADMIHSAKNENVTSGKYYLIKLVQAVNPEMQTTVLVGYKSESLINMFIETYPGSLSIVEIEDEPIPLSPSPEGSDVSPTMEPHDDIGAIEPTESSLNLLPENEVAEQYAILSGLTQ